MAKLNDKDKLINYIKNLINNKDLEIPNDTIENLEQSLGFKISKIDIIKNTREQILNVTDDIEVDYMFLLDYIKKRRSVLIKSISHYSYKFNSDLDKFVFVYEETIKMIKEEYTEDYFSNPFMIETMTQKAKIDWDSLYRYVKYNILNYSVEQNIAPNIMRKLKELIYGRILGNKNTDTISYYSISDILYTFKYSYFDIEKGLKYKSFDSELQKFNYICAIVKNNINEVISKLRAKETANEKLFNTDLSYLSDNENQAEYYRRTEECLPELEDLW